MTRKHNPKIQPFKYHKPNVTFDKNTKYEPNLNLFKPYPSQFTVKLDRKIVEWKEDKIRIEKVYLLGALYKHLYSTDNLDMFVSLEIATVPSLRDIAHRLITITPDYIPSLVREINREVPLLYKLTLHTFVDDVIENQSLGTIRYKEYFEDSLSILLDPINSVATIVNFDRESITFNENFSIQQESLLKSISSQNLIYFFQLAHAKFVNIINNNGTFPTSEKVFYHPKNKVAHKVRKYLQRQKKRKQKQQRYHKHYFDIEIDTNKISDHMYEEPLGNKPKKWQGLAK